MPPERIRAVCTDSVIYGIIYQWNDCQCKHSNTITSCDDRCSTIYIGISRGIHMSPETITAIGAYGLTDRFIDDRIDCQGEGSNTITTGMSRGGSINI